MGERAAREGLEALGDFRASAAGRARDDWSAVALLESTSYLANQLLRDGDWASMAHSVELRTPLVDATLLQTLAPYVSRFRGGTGKSMLAQCPLKPLPTFVMNRRKTGFSIPMEKWLSRMSLQRSGIYELPGTLGTFWARRWATAVVAEAAT